MIPRADERPNTIGLQWDGKFEEGRCAVAFLPGFLLEITTATIDGVVYEKNNAQLPFYVKKNSVAANPSVIVALQDLLGNFPTSSQGRTINTPYVPVSGTDSTAAGFYAGDVVPVVTPKAGDVFLIRVATNAHLTYGALLKAHTDGTLIAGAVGDAIARVAEDRDFATVETGVVTPLLRVQFI